MTLIQKFWSRALAKKQSTAMVLRHPENSDVKVELSYEVCGYAVASIMAYLRKRGVKKGDRVAILGWNSPEWVWGDFAIQSIGAVTVPIYPNSSAEQVNYVLKDSGAVLTLSNESEQLKKVTLGGTVHFDEIPCVLQPGLSAQPFLYRVMPSHKHSSCYKGFAAIAEMKAMKAELGKDDFAGLNADDLATIVYTSGSSGAPKGCMITHGNIASALTALSQIELNLSGEKDLYLSYLPIAHVLERINGTGLCTWNGVPLAFSTIEDMRKNVAFFRPTCMSGVPAVWEKIYNGAMNPTEGAPALLNKVGLWKPLLNAALNADRAGKFGKFTDEHILAKIRGKLGRLELLVSGGAPIPPKVLNFFKGLNLEILEGYGATETASGIVTNRPSWAHLAGPKNKVGTVGLVLPGCEVRIVVQEGEEDLGSGEIQLRGAQVFKGYWNLPAETAAAFTADGWFRTGDLGMLDADGFLKITGRMNGMYKTSGGKYVPREKLEAALKPFPIVQYSLPVAHGRKFPVVLIWADPIVAATLVARPVPAGVDAASWYSEQPEVLKAVDEAVSGANKSLEHWERMQYSKVMPIAATLDNGIITETLKIRSKVLLKRFEKEIDALYADAGKGSKKGAEEGLLARLRGWFSSLSKKN
jgi:long-chain acyl-CoA synthetase